MKYFAIGDLHGHFDLWMQLYDKIVQLADFKPERDTLVFLGDYVDGGSQTKQLLDWLMEHKRKYPHWVMLYGNHEDLMLDALLYKGQIYGQYQLWYRQGGRATYESFVPKELTEYERSISQVEDHITTEYLDFLRNLPMYYEIDNYFFVHAGLIPSLTIEEHKQALEKDRGLKNRVRQEMLWIRKEFILSSYDWGKKVVFGHTVFSRPHVEPNKIGIDGMFHNCGRLHALELPSEKFYTVTTPFDFHNS